MHSFNLAYQPWIPCLLSESNVPRELSLLDALTRAREIREISDDSPLVTVALHRLLLAILHRNFGPASFSEWKRLWQQGRWDELKLREYFGRWQNRFDLFDTERPFYQVPYDEKIKSDPLILLAQELASGNNATLFDHSFSASSRSFAPPQAACFLLSRQAFAFAGTGGYLNSTLVDGYTVLVLGNNLFETLALNMLPYNEERPIPHKQEDSESRDMPFWEQDQRQEPDNNKQAAALGWLDYLTWQSRRIHLIAEDETLSVRQCQHSQKLKLKIEQGILDPFKSYERGNDKRLKARRLKEARALWRDSHSLFEEASDLGEAKIKRPEIFNHLAQIDAARKRGEIKSQPAYSFSVFGMVNYQASVSMWSRERLPLPLSYLINKQLTSTLDDALKLTEKIADNLTDSIRTLAVSLVGKGEAKDLVRSFEAAEFYWSRLDAPFKKFLIDLADEFEESQDGDTTLTHWAHIVSRTARAAIDNAINSLSGSARELQAAAQAEGEYAKLMGRTRKAYSHLFPEKQN